MCTGHQLHHTAKQIPFSNMKILFMLTGHHEVVKFLLEHCEVPADPKDR